PMSSGVRVASSSGCATKPKAREIGWTGYAGLTQHSLRIGHYVMATAEHREPCDSRGSCTVLGAPGGEIPPGDSAFASFPLSRRVRFAPRADIRPMPAFMSTRPTRPKTNLLKSRRAPPAPGAAAVRDSTLAAWYPSFHAPRTGGAYDSHHRTAGIAGRARRRCGRVAAHGARTAAGD